MRHEHAETPMMTERNRATVKRVLAASARVSAHSTSYPLLILLATAILVLTGTTAARAATGTSASTYNRPSTTEFDGGTYIAWAAKSGAGQVYVGILGNNGTIAVTWTDSSSSTYPGTGPTIAASGGALVVTWLDGSLGCNGGKSPCEQIAEIVPGASGGFQCETQFEGSGYYTPYLTSSGDNGAGPLYLTVADGLGAMHILTLTLPKVAAGCQFGIQKVDRITSDTTWDGPAMVVSGYGTTSQAFWLMWAGTDAAHHLNIAQYNSSWTLVAKKTETTHATLTDMGAAFATGYNYIWMSYCGTNNNVYYQFFTTVSNASETQLPGASCDIDYYQGFYSGGVGISFNYTDGSMLLTWADKTSQQVMMAVT